MLNKEETDRQQMKLQRLSRQLLESELLLERHPLTSETLVILQNALSYLHKQAEWSSAGHCAKFLMTLDTALCGMNTTQSASGFVGPSMGRLFEGVHRLVEGALPKSEHQSASLINTLMTMMTVGMVFITTQTLGNWKQLFPNNDPGEVKNAGLLLRELGVTFILGSSLIESTFAHVAKELKCNDKCQLQISRIALGLVALVMLWIDEEDALNDEFFDMLSPFLLGAIPPIEEVIKQLVDRRVLDQEKGDITMSQLQLIRRSLGLNDREEFKQAIANCLEIYDLRDHEVKNDLRGIINVCSKLYATFRNIFFQAELPKTSVTQAA